MLPHTATPAKKGLTEKVALVALVSLSVLSVLAVAMVTSYLNRIDESTSSLTHTDAMPGYVGRPEPAVAANGTSPMNFLVLVTSGDNTLQAVVVANLSASRRNLTLITVPADLLVSEVNAQTLSSTYSMDPTITIRAMEGLTGARMDHQLILDLDGLAAALDTVGGVELDGTRLTGAQAVSQVEAQPNSTSAALASGNLLRAGLISTSGYANILDPAKFSRVISALAPCLAVDSDLTSDVVESTLIESSVHPDETRLWPLTSTTGTLGSTVDAGSLEALRSALAVPDLAITQQYQSTAFLPQEPRK
jgi:hypothetical protein